jgi:hypothetical protein
MLLGAGLHVYTDHKNILNVGNLSERWLGWISHVDEHVGSSPGNLGLNRDMFLNFPLIADWHNITQRREHLIHENLMRENQTRRGYNYAPQQMVLKKKWKPKKLGKRTSGPYKIAQVHVNGTVTI